MKMELVFEWDSKKAEINRRKHSVSFEEAKKLYTELGDFIKQKCKGTTAFIYQGNPVLRKSIGLKTSKRVPLVNGKLEGVLVQIDSYEGSKKKYYAAYKAEEELAKNKQTSN